MPYGYLITVVLIGWGTWWAVLPPRRTNPYGSLIFTSGLLVSELPVLVLLALTWSTWLAFVQGDIHTPAGWVVVGIAILEAIGLVIVIRRGLRAIPAIRRSLDEGLGTDWRDVVGADIAEKHRPRFRLIALLGPFFRRRWDVERIANIPYGDAGLRNLLDVYRHRSRPTNAPVLIHFHSGAFVQGKKNREGLPLIYRLASKGWVCISANYRLKPAATFPDPLVDAKKVVAWVREHADEIGADPSSIFIAGGSAGGQLAAQAALTANDPELQPGFERADTSVAAAIPLYGYYGWIRNGFLRQVAERRRDAPPIFVIHGDLDSLCPVETTRRFVQELRSFSPSPVVYAELPGALHTFDLFHSIRNEAVIDGIEAFAAWVLAARAARPEVQLQDAYEHQG